MRVGVLVHKCSGGGAERVAGQVSRLLDEQGVDVFFFTFFQREEEYPFAGERVSFPEERTRSLSTMWKRMRWVKKMKREKKLDVMISFLPQANLINLITGGRAIVSIRNNPDKLSSSYKALFALTLHRADRVVAVSKGVEENLIRQYPAIRGRTTTIYSPLGNFNSQERSLRPVKRILTVGRLESQKAQSRLIEAFSRIAIHRPELSLRIIGEGSLKEQLKAQAQATGFGNRIEFLPYITAIEQEYEAADLMVMTSDYEGLSNVLLESLAKGLPVISTDCPYGSRELMAPGTDVSQSAKQMEIHAFGILTPLREEEDTIAAVAKAMVRLCDDEDLRSRLNREGPKRVKDFSREEIGQVWRRLLNP